MSPIPPGKKLPSGKDRGWRVLIDGIEQEVGLIELISQYGKLTYALRPEGYDAWVFEEAGGGGAITIPYCITSAREILVGLLGENRPNMVAGADLNSLCVIGGFNDFGETTDQTQSWELTEETGLDLKAKKMDGLALNPNRAFFVTNHLEDKGVIAYCVRITEKMLTQDHNEENCFIFNDPENIIFKKAANVCFYRWEKAITFTADALAAAAIGRLAASLK